MRILMVCSKSPWPPVDGGAIAMLNMLQGFHKAGHRVTVLAMNTPKHQADLRDLPARYEYMADFHLVDVDTRVRLLDVLTNFLFSRQSYHAVRFRSRLFEEELIRLLQLENGAYDLVQLETLFMLNYSQAIRAHAPRALIAFRAHNIEHEIWERRADNEGNPLKRYLFAETAYRMRAFEQKQLAGAGYDVVVPISGRDDAALKKLGARGASYVCPSGMDLPGLDTRPVEVEYPSVGYIGALDWEPNREGIDWFLKEVWPKVHARHPEVPFYLAGRNMPLRMQGLTRHNIKPLGEVPDAAAFLKSKAVMVAPIFSGSGIRIKVVEGMAYGKAIVATTLAAEGIGVRHGDNIFLADTPRDFAERLSALIEHRNLCETIGTRAAEFIQQRFDNDRLVGGLLQFYEKQVARRQAEG
ncbi:MAG: glycosyltransferase [Bacteroidetes bacterium]|nr:MAG: glycosyltransferase [Bacteroidota bacterium]